MLEYTELEARQLELKRRREHARLAAAAAVASEKHRRHTKVRGPYNKNKLVTAS